MGCSKNYIMYWGVFTLIIVPFSHSKVCTNFQKNSHSFYSICIAHKFHIENTTYFLHKRMAFLGFYFGLTILPLLSQDRREKKSQASLVSFPHPALFLITRVKKRQPPIGCPFKEKVFLLWGVVKTIYIMYWGVFTLIIVSPLPFKVCTNFTKVVPTFCILYIVPFSHFRKNFYLCSIPPLSQLQHQLRSGIMLQIHLFQSFLFPKEGLLIYGVHHYFPE